MRSFLAAMVAAAAMSLADDTSVVYFPPQNDASDTISDFTVTAGDMINITWSATYKSVDLHIEASAPDSNFTVTPFYNPGLNANSYFPYVLQPHDYLIDDPSKEIQAFFLLADHADDSQFVRTQNFTIKQPKQQSVNPDGQITVPAGAETWTGSVTLLTSQGGEQFVTGSPGPSGASPTTTPSFSVSSTTPSGTQGVVPTVATASNAPASSSSAGSLSSSSSSDSSPSSGLSMGAKIGIGVGVAVGVLLIGALIVLAILLARSKRKSSAASQHQPLAIPPGVSEKSGQGLGGEAWQYQNSYAPGMVPGSQQQQPPVGEYYKNDAVPPQGQARVLNEVDGSGPGVAQGGVSELDGLGSRGFAELGGGQGRSRVR